MRWFQERSATVWLLILVAVWTTEFWLVQDSVLVPTFKIPEAFLTRKMLRLGLDVGFVLLAVFSMPRRALYWVFALQAAVFLLGGVYCDHYGRLPKLSMLAQSSESAAIWSMVVGMLEPTRTAVFAGAGLLKAALVWVAQQKAHRAPRVAPKWFRVAGVVVYLAVFAAANLTLDPLSNMMRWGTTSRYGLTYGIAVPLVTEAYLSRGTSFKERALESAARSTDRLSPIEGDFPVHDRVVFLQVESLDWGVVDLSVAGREVMPRLNALKERSMFFKAEAAHFTGSADSDFVALNGVWPSRDLVTYKIEDYPFDGALPHELKRRGFHTASIHGVSGDFFNRRPAYEKMGLSERNFREELAAAGVPARHAKYDWIQDGELFEFAGDKLAAQTGKTFHLVITVTSHSPFKELPGDERHGCSDSDQPLDHYVCSMAYVDRSLGAYLDRLPEETTVVIYGDHNSSIVADGYDSGRRDDRDFVPVLIYSHGENLAARQNTRAQTIATDGSLTFVDVMRYVHGQILAQHSASRK